MVTGTDTIDCPHRWLFIMANDLLDAMDEGKGKKILDRVFEYLDYYVKRLRNEEAMIGYNYGCYSLPKTGHRQFVRDISRLRKEFVASGATLHLVVQTQQKLCNWLADQAKKVDKNLGVCVKSLIRDENG
jgi:hemerythrin